MWPSRRKDVCGNREIRHPALLPLVLCFCGRELFVRNWSQLGSNKRKIPNYKMRFEVIFHPGLDIWGSERTEGSQGKRKCYSREEVLLPQPLKVFLEFRWQALGFPRTE